MSEQLANFAFTQVGLGGYAAASGFLNVLDTATGSGIQPFPGAPAFSLVLCNPPAPISNGAPKTLLQVTAINSATQFAVTNNGITPDVNCNPGDFVYCVQDARSLRAIILQTSAILGSSYITANEGLAAGGAYTDLATLDSVGPFTLVASTKVVVQYSAYENGLNSGAGNLYYNIVNVDGTDVTSPTSEAGMNPPVGGNAWGGVVYAATLAAGSHTIKIRHKVVGAGTGNWTNRLLTVQASN